MKTNRHKQGILLFFVVTTLCIGLLPAVNINKQGWTRDTEVLFNADWLDSVASWFSVEVLKRSSDRRKVVVGKNGFMFLGNNYGKATYRTQNIDPYQMTELFNWADEVSRLQQWYEEQGIAFILAVVPNKQSVYSEHLPNWIEVKRPNLTDRMVELAKQKQLNLLDLRDVMAKAKTKTDGLLYWKTDSHWNLTGAATAFDAIISQLNRNHQLGLMSPVFELSETPPMAMDLIQLLNVNPWLSSQHESSMLMTFESEVDFCQRLIKDDQSAQGPCEPVDSAYLEIHQSAQHITNSLALNNSKVLLMCDSFGRQIFPLYAQSFQSVFAYHYNKLKEQALIDLVNKERPDVVVYQVVERNLLKHKYHQNEFINSP